MAENKLFGFLGGDSAERSDSLNMEPPAAARSGTATTRDMDPGHAPKPKFNVAIAAGPSNGPPPLPDHPILTGLPDNFIQDLLLKIVYFDGRLRGVDIAHAACLNYTAIEDALDFLKNQQFLAVVGGGSSFGKQSMEYTITEKGIGKTRELLVRDNYYGPAPVPLSVFVRRVELQSMQRHHVTPERVEKAFSRLVLDPAVPEMMGPAINSGRSMFIYGPPGNGKTALAECITESVGGEVYIPRAIVVERQIIKLFDPLYHHEVEPTPAEAAKMDRRWVKCKRPVVMVGGELTLETLDLVAHGGATYYEAPFQLKATNGVLFIDDFGRQLANPDQLLNRWIVPLESRFDFLTFASGLKVRVPFDCLLVFSTNLDPKQLVDDAFLRRIRYKIHVDNPTEDAYRRIFKIVARAKAVEYEQSTLEHLIARHYKEAKRPFRACHPRDLLEQFSDISKYRGQEKPPLTPEAVDRLAKYYFTQIMD